MSTQVVFQQRLSQRQRLCCLLLLKAQVKDALQENRTLDYITDIEKLTKGQSENSEWFDYRKVVITASISHNILSKVRNPAGSCGDNLVARVLGYNR